MCLKKQVNYFSSPNYPIHSLTKLVESMPKCEPHYLTILANGYIEISTHTLGPFLFFPIL